VNRSICFDLGPTTLLIRKNYLLKLLGEQKLRLMWTVLAEFFVVVVESPASACNG
jgi:hypothetical protein